MTKVRVYEVARELGVQNRELVQKIASLGIQVRNHMSVLDPVEVDRVKRSFDKGQSDKVVEERIRPTVVRRRSAARKAEPTPAPQEAEGPAAPEKPAAAPAEPAAPVAPRIQADKPAAAPPVEEAPPPTAAAAPAPPRPQEEPEAPAPAAPPAPAPEPPAPPAAAGEESARPSQPPPASVRFAHANLPPGVVARGSTVAPGAAPLPESARTRIVTQHQQRRPEAPRRRELGRAALGPTGRPAGRGPGRPGKKKMAPGKKGKQTEITVPSAQKRVIRIEDQVQLQTLAQRMSLKATDVLMKLMQLGMSGVHINSTLDADTAKILASEFGYEVENVARSEEEIVGDARGEFENLEEDRQARPPVVTVMGHVDHGKTSLLDRIRKADVVSGEAGGITQHIGAYRVETDKGTVVFLDTPGHEAFTSMRARGAQATDVVILVVAADDGVMPQTREAVAHAKAAEVPIVVAVNKIDRPDANADRIKNELAADGLQPEEWGGDTMFIECSAITGQGVDDLLSSVLLQSELLELKANPKIPAEGVVLEAYLDRGRGPVANVLVRDGHVATGEFVVAGSTWGRVRALADDRGKQLKEAGPSTPVEILGMSDVPSAGDMLYKVTDQKKAQEVAESHRQLTGEKATAPLAARGLDQLQQLMKSGEVEELRLVVKADVQGSLEALNKSLEDLATEKVKVQVIHSAVGAISENDIMLAAASNAIIIGFSVRPQGQASATAKKENVEIRIYNIIYEVIDDVKKAMTGLLAPKLVEKELGKAEVRQTFGIPKVGTVAGCYVTDGKVTRSAKARLVRDGIQVWQGELASLKRFKEDTREVAAGYECGISLQGYNDVKEKDIIEVYEVEEVAAEL
jgi:translation initiation factor IF-2